MRRHPISHLAISAIAVTLTIGLGPTTSEAQTQPPLCDANGDYLVPCAAGAATVQLDGSGSFEPGGQPLDFQWSTDCPGGMLINPMDVAPILVLDPPPPCPVSCTVTLTVTSQGSGLTDTCSANVQVVDDSPPQVLGDPTNEACLWPANHHYVCFDDVTQFVQVDDDCDANASLVGVVCQSNQPDDSPGGGDGNTTNDCLYDARRDRVCMRAERASGDANGRTYALLFTAADGCGNESPPWPALVVHVPSRPAKGQDCIDTTDRAVAVTGRLAPLLVDFDAICLDTTIPSTFTAPASMPAVTIWPTEQTDGKDMQIDQSFDQTKDLDKTKKEGKKKGVNVEEDKQADKSEIIDNLKELDGNDVWIYFGHGKKDGSGGAEIAGRSGGRQQPITTTEVTTALNSDNDPPGVVFLCGCELGELTDEFVNSCTKVAVGWDREVSVEPMRRALNTYWAKLYGGATFKAAKEAAEAEYVKALRDARAKLVQVIGLIDSILGKLEEPQLTQMRTRRAQAVTKRDEVDAELRNPPKLICKSKANIDLARDGLSKAIP